MNFYKFQKVIQRKNWGGGGLEVVAKVRKFAFSSAACCPFCLCLFQVLLVFIWNMNLILLSTLGNRHFAVNRLNSKDFLIFGSNRDMKIKLWVRTGKVSWVWPLVKTCHSLCTETSLLGSFFYSVINMTESNLELKHGSYMNFSLLRPFTLYLKTSALLNKSYATVISILVLPFSLTETIV